MASTSAARFGLVPDGGGELSGLEWRGRRDLAADFAIVGPGDRLEWTFAGTGPQPAVRLERSD